MSFLDAELASMRTTVNQYLLDKATVARTSVTVACSVTDDTGHAHLAEVPEPFLVTRWLITMPDATDATYGDVLTVKDGTTGVTKGTYSVIQVTSPATLSLSTVVRAVKTS